MKTVAVRELQKSVRACVDTAQKEHVVITRRGQPAAVLIGVEGKDWEAVILETSQSFWKLIENRRKEKAISLARMRKLVKAAPPARSRRRTSRATRP